MDALHQLEIALILWIQSLGSWLELPLKAATMMGKEEFFTLVMPSLYWCLDGVLGFRVGIMLLLSNGFNSIFKLAFHSPRPYWFDANVRALDIESSFGVPSGHAQHAFSIWGLIATSTRSQTARILLALLIFLIGFSRLYLGMHFLSDVILGWALGALTLWIYLKVEAPVRAWLKTLSLRQMLLTALVTSLILGGSVLISTAALGNWQVPTQWQQTAMLTLPEGKIDPLNLDGAFTIAGTWLGLMAGAAWFYQRTGGLFNAAGTNVQRLLRYGVGLIGILILWFGLGQIFPRNAEVLSFALRYLRYTLVGLWISALAPLVFERIGLAKITPKLIPSLSTD